MVYYKENPNLESLEIVTTISGEKEYRKNCKYIKQKYYTINKECFEIEGKWRKYNNENMVFDWERGTYVLRATTHLIYGLIRNKEGVLEMGYYSPNPYNNISSVSKAYGSIPAISETALGDRWFEDMRLHLWYLKDELSTTDISRKKQIDNYENPQNRGYNIEDNSNDYDIKVRNYNNYSIPISPKIKQLSKYVGDLTFGFEFELSRGFLPYHLQSRHGVVPCRDGSLNGGIELVTIPKSGAKGIQSTINLCDDISLRGQINFDCSMHIHFGNFGTDKLSIISLYRLCRNLQEELFTMFPYYKTDPNGIKQKNYMPLN